MWALSWIAAQPAGKYEVAYAFQDWSFFCGAFAKLSRRAKRWVFDALDDPALPLRTVEGQQCLQRDWRGVLTRHILRVAERMKRHLTPGADGVIVTAVNASDPLPSRLIAEYGVQPHRLLMLTNGVDLERTRPVGLQRPHSGAFVVVYVGLVSPLRGLDILLPAIELAVGEIPQIRLELVGKATPPDVAWLRAELDRRMLGDAVMHHGELPSDQAWQVMETASVCVNPIHRPENAYAFPIKIYEYLALGCPVIASDLPGIRHIVRHEENGLLFEPGNTKALANSLIRLYRDPDLRRIMADAARETVRDSDWPKVHTKLGEWLGGLICAPVS
jgi:glycosyltransferase involved in cell wall biosynthesis